MTNLSDQDQFLPKYETARIATLRARQIVRNNNEMIARLKNESQIPENQENFENLENEDLGGEAEIFSHHDSYAFDLYKIKSSNRVLDFIKDMFGV